jgi:hypothetical protein
VPISADLFIWFCSLLQWRRYEGAEVSFKECTRNAKSTRQSLQPWLMEPAIMRTFLIRYIRQ